MVENVAPWSVGQDIKEKAKMEYRCTNLMLNWNQTFQGGDWKVTDQTFICNKHFTASDFVTERHVKYNEEYEKERYRAKKYSFLKSDVHPMIYPQLPTISVTKETG